MRHVSAGLLLLAFLVPHATAQTSPGGAPADVAAPDDPQVQSARAKTCLEFMKEASAHKAAGGASVQTPSFALVWGWLLARDPSSGAYMGKQPLGQIMFDNTMTACQRMRSRTLGATMDYEYAHL